MKRTLLTIVALLPLLSAWGMQRLRAEDDGAAANTISGWADRVKTFGAKLAQEQIFVHMDNTCYFLGDTIYYKAYVRQSSTGKPSRMSGVLYADLINQDGFLVQRQQLELRGGQAHGSFVLQDTLYGGYYELRAYTRWQLNWGRTTHPHTQLARRAFVHQGMADEYYTDYEKLYSRVFPVYDKPEEPGLFTHDMTLRPMRRHFKASDKPLAGKVQLFPEGGNLVEGVPCRVAFEANNVEEKHLEGTLVIHDSQGNTVAEAKTESRGRGTVEFTPQAGATYRAVFTWDEGTAESKLPETQTDGVALRVTRDAAGIVTARLSAQGTAATRPLGVTVMTDGVTTHSQELPPAATHTVTMDTRTWRSGVAQLTVFDAEGRIYADRLFFVRNGDMGGTYLAFDGVADDPVQPFAHVTLGVAGGQPGSVISMAVRDAAHSEYTHDSGNILTEMLLASQIRGFVENPQYFFEADDAEHQRALDLLLMVQGWRRHDWRTMATPGAFTLHHMPEVTPFFTGEVRKYQTDGSEDYSIEFARDMALQEQTEQAGKDMEERVEGAYKEGNLKDLQTSLDENNRAMRSSDNSYVDKINNRREYKGSLSREVMMHAEFTKPGAPEGIVGEMMTKGNQFSIQSPRFFEGCYFFLSASDTTRWKEKDRKNHLWIREARDKRNELNYPEFYVRLKRYNPRFVKPYTWYQCHLADLPTTIAKDMEWLADGTRRLSEITVTGRTNYYTRFDANHPAYVIDAYEAFNEACDVGLMPCIFEGGEVFSQAVALTYIGDMNMERRYDLERRYDHLNESSYIPKEVKKYYNHLERLDKVYIYTDYSPRREGDKRYEQDNQPEVVVDLRLVPDDGVRPTFRDRRYVLPGFAVCEEFYQPDYSAKPLPDTKDYRRTLYWNPNLRLDDQGRAAVTFYNNASPSRLSISAEGLADDGTLMTTRPLKQ